jgi:hypothetical protein
MKRIAGVLTLTLVVVPILLVVGQAVRTLDTLTCVERERDAWQRPTLVIVDRGPRDGDESRAASGHHHELTAAVAERDITRLGFRTVVREDRFIDRPADDLWWLMVFRKP